MQQLSHLIILIKRLMRYQRISIMILITIDFFRRGLLFIKNDPILFIKRYINKSIAFLFFNLKSKYNDYYNLLNILPLVILSLLFVSSILLCFQKNLFHINT